MTIRYRVDARNRLVKVMKDLENVYKSVQPKTLAKQLDRVGQKWIARIKKGFYNSHDPYGVPWAALKNPSKRRGGPSAKPLLDDGRLVNSLKFYQEGSKLFVDSNMSYARFHQNGTKRIRQRAFLPDQRGMPDGFRIDLEQALLNTIKKMN